MSNQQHPATTEELLSQILVQQRREARATRVAAFAVFVLVIALLAVLAVFVPRAVALFDHAQASLSQVDALLAEAEPLIGSIGAMAENANSMLADHTEGVSEAVEKLNSIDIAALNDAIHGLSEAVGPLAQLARLFG